MSKAKAECFDCGHSIVDCVCVDNVGCGCCNQFDDIDGCKLEPSANCPKD
jgi:hypothetical protein